MYNLSVDFGLVPSLQNKDDSTIMEAKECNAYKEYGSIEDVIKFKLENGFEPSKEDLYMKEEIENQKLIEEHQE